MSISKGTMERLYRTVQALPAVFVILHHLFLPLDEWVLWLPLALAKKESRALWLHFCFPWTFITLVTWIYTSTPVAPRVHPEPKDKAHKLKYIALLLGLAVAEFWWLLPYRQASQVPTPPAIEDGASSHSWQPEFPISLWILVIALTGTLNAAIMESSFKIVPELNESDRWRVHLKLVCLWMLKLTISVWLTAVMLRTAHSMTAFRTDYWAHRWWTWGFSTIVYWKWPRTFVVPTLDVYKDGAWHVGHARQPHLLFSQGKFNDKALLSQVTRVPIEPAILLLLFAFWIHVLLLCNMLRNIGQLLLLYVDALISGDDQPLKDFFRQLWVEKWYDLSIGLPMLLIVAALSYKQWRKYRRNRAAASQGVTPNGQVAGV